MKAQIQVPAVGESITEATIGEWTKKSGEFVKRDEVILLLETDKASVEVVAPNDGVLTIDVPAGTTVKIGATVASIDTEGVATAGQVQPVQNRDQSASQTATGSAPSSASSDPTRAGAVVPMAANGGRAHDVLSPATRRVVEQHGLNPNQIQGTGPGGRITKHDAELAAKGQGAAGASANGGATSGTAKALSASAAGGAGLELTGGATAIGAAGGVSAKKVSGAAAGGTRRVPMTTIRKRIAERLVQAQHTAAILTTFNEVDMTQVMAVREKYKDRFKERYGTSLGFMGFFVKASVEALKEIPQVNGFIDGSDIVYHDYCNVGVAVGTEKGLIVPVLKNAESMSIAEIELAIKNFALKGRDGKISVDDLSGGTFTISNGGVYGSLMSTPILNPPQSGILGLHKIEDRPVVVTNGGKKEIAIRPMMYIALSYDHRIIDGKEAVTFLVRIKENIEDPTRLLLEI